MFEGIKINWRTAFLVSIALLGWVAAMELFVILNQSTTIDIHEKKCAELESDLKALAGLLPGKLSRKDVSEHKYQRLQFTINEKDTVVGVRYWWDKLH